MAFEWLHMPSEHGYNRRRHLAATPPDFWSRHDKYYGKWERSKYFRALHKGTPHKSLDNCFMGYIIISNLEDVYAPPSNLPTVPQASEVILQS
jgi:hypothetical protein